MCRTSGIMFSVKTSPPDPALWPDRVRAVSSKQKHCHISYYTFKLGVVIREFRHMKLHSIPKKMGLFFGIIFAIV